MSGPSQMPVAVVGMGGVFPGAPNVGALWDLVAAGRDATGEVPAQRWVLPPALALAAGGPQPDAVLSVRAGLLESLPPLPSLELMPHELRGLDPSVHVLLAAGAAAWADAVTAPVDPRRAAVVLGNIVLPTDGASELSQWVVGQTLERRVLGAKAPPPGVAPSAWNRWVAGLPAGVLAQALGLGGDHYTLDAACASSLFAMQLAAAKLRRGEADVVLTGGLSRPSSLYTQMGFSQLGALSPTGRCSPFDAAADGLVVGEGAGVLVLKRLDDALAHGDTIRAVLRGVGVSNDVDGRLLAPSTEGQLRSMHAAYDRAGWTPGDVDFVECHATGTPVGDAVEFESLRRLRRDAELGGSVVVGASKANVGHLLTAAGAVAAIKAIVALEHGTVPPVANFRTLSPRIQDAGREPGVRVPTATESWADTGRPRRAAVSGFGFGGTNAHVLLEHADSVRRRPLVAVGGLPTATPAPAAPLAIAVVGLGAHVGPWTNVAAVRERLFGSDDPALGQKAHFAQEAAPHGWFIDALEVPIDRFRIPPAELRELLPQQLVLLGVAHEAMADLRAEAPDRLRCGVFAGVELDFGTTDYHLRWEVRAREARWAETLGVPADEVRAWSETLRARLSPALNANRTMGGLASVAASRVARAMGFGGPSYTLSAEESGGVVALQTAAQALRDFDVDFALAGGVGLGGDVRAWLGTQSMMPAADCAASEGAVCLALKRLEDAERDGDRVYGVIDGLGAATRSGTWAAEPSADAMRRSLAQALRGREDAGPTGLLDSATAPGSAAYAAERSACPDALECTHTALRLGHAGPASGLLSTLAGVLRLHHHVLEDDGGGGVRRWLQDDACGARTVVTGSWGASGHVGHVLLRECSKNVVHWTPPISEGLFSLDGADRPALIKGLQRLESVARDGAARTAAALAQGWRKESPSNPEAALCLCVVSGATAELAELCAELADELRGEGPLRRRAPGRVMFTEAPCGRDADIAFVFPGSGNHYPGMGKQLALDVPDLTREPHTHLRTQLSPRLCWATPEEAMHQDARGLILSQVTLGSLSCAALRNTGVEPQAVIGYSLGETAGFFALGAWTERAMMLERVATSPLFATELTGPCDAARRLWDVPPHEAVRWTLGVAEASADVVDRALASEDRAYRLIVNTPSACVVGGDTDAVQRVIAALDVPFRPLGGVTTVHCEVVREVQDAYRELHVQPTTPPAGVRFYSGCWGHAYDVTAESAADSVTAQAVEGLDYPTVVRQAYDDGVRLFIEMGPGRSCSRMIGEILGDRPHLARSVCAFGAEGRGAMLRTLGWLLTHRVHVHPERLDAPPLDVLPSASSTRSVRVPVGRAKLGAEPPRPYGPPTRPPHRQVASPAAPVPETAPMTTEPAPQTSPAPSWMTLLRARADAHEAFLQTQTAITEAAAALLHGTPAARGLAPTSATPVARVWTDPEPPRALDREACLLFATGRIGDTLGPRYAAIDAHPTRVRLPDEPLMLVDRVLDITGEPCSMGSGGVVTEHDVRAGAWYLDAGRIPTCVAVEAGQADLFLSAFLGVDFETKGLAVYRLLDATVTFRGRLPAVGQTIHYDIRLLQFFRQGDTWLFRFEYDATVEGQPLMSMRDGVAGFFSEAALAAGKGVVDAGLAKLAPREHSTLAERPSFTPVVPRTLDSAQLESLRSGDLAAAFGPAFARLDVPRPRTLPGAPMNLVHRITALEPEGGPFGLGRVVGEADIHADDWFITCHFVDDPVMPGTLMYECCLHTLRVFLLSLGWVGDERASFEPREGVRSRLKCRGQVLGHTKVVTYEVSMRVFGADPEPYVICDATMYADGKRIVDIEDMSAQLRGVDVSMLQARWGGAGPSPTQAAAPSGWTYDKASLEAFAFGRPSDAFGPPYAVFDGPDRSIARLPGAPFQFIDRVPHVTGTPFVLEAGPSCVAEVDRTTWAWTLEANAQQDMAFAVLLEIGLQACGWLAAYAGSALTSDTNLHFRNLGGKATLHRAIGDNDALLVMRSTMTGVSSSGAMIIQHFDFSVETSGGEMVYAGTTYFGFFTAAALSEQKGLRGEELYVATEADRAASLPVQRVPTAAPLPTSRFRMVDHVQLHCRSGGRHGRGFIEGTIDVDPEFWFFKAHFHEDPVWPGSLGLEAFLQLLKVFAMERFGLDGNARFSTMPLEHEHGWEYRGQVVPSAGTVTVQAHIREVDAQQRRLVADGILSVDGRPIYSMKSFALEVRA